MDPATPPQTPRPTLASGAKKDFRAVIGWCVRYPPRNLAVDFLRGIAILLVVITHINQGGIMAPPAVIPAGWFDLVKRNGGLGVSLFFAISGFLITQTSLQRFGTLARISLRDFYAFRISRILPPLLLLVACNLMGAAFALRGYVIPPEMPVSRLLGHVFTFRFNLLYLDGGAVLTAWAPLWSLAIEEVFYLGFPLLAVALRRGSLLVLALFAMAVYGPFYRQQHGWGGCYLYWGCFDLLAIGCLAAIAAWHFEVAQWQVRRLRLLQGSGAVLLVGVYFSGDLHQNWVWQPTAMAAGAALFLVGCAGTPARPAAGFQTLAWPVALAGFLSYELYLFHLPVLLLLKAPWPLDAAGALPVPRDLALIPVLVLLVILAGLLHTWFSEPCLRSLRKVLVPLSRSSSIPGPAA